MKRATALKLLATTLVLLTVASAVPVAFLLQDTHDAATPGASSPAGGAATSHGVPPTGLPFGPAGNPSAQTPPGPADGGKGGASSRPGQAGTPARGTGSALLDQVIGAAALMGIDAEVPDLPLHRLEPVDPLRAAILGWVAATNAQVPPDELSRELARADALPLDLQRDVAILLLAATDAVLLQREATAVLTPEQLNWIYANPGVAAALARGEDTPETRQLAAVAGLVDVRKSIQASLLLLTAVEATRGSLAAPETQDALAALDSPDLDAATQAILKVLATAGAQTTDQEKVRFAARLVAATTGADVPAPVEAASFADAVARLAAATAQTPDPAHLEGVLARADALPDDLEKALAAVILAQALAVDAAAAPSTQAQGEAMARVLVTVAQALPTLEKTSLYWSQAPEALRVGQWSPQARIGWALEHAAYFVATRGDPADVVRAAGLLHGAPLQDAAVPERGFVDAYVALATQNGDAVNASMTAAVRAAADRLDPRVQRAAALLMSGAAESGRLHREAFAALTPQERSFLLASGTVDAAYLDADVTQAEVDRLATLASLASRVDRAKLAQAELVGVLAVTQARDALDGFTAQGGARPLAPGLLGLLQRLAPWSTARAQSACVEDGGEGAEGLVGTDCANDVLLFVRSVGTFFPTPECSAQGSPAGLVSLKECAESYDGRDESDKTLLLITGTGRSRLTPDRETLIFVDPGCDPTATACSFQPRQRDLFGAPKVVLDLGGSDVYARPVAMTFPTQRLPVSLHLDMGGADEYQDATHVFDQDSPLWRYLGSQGGHPTQGAAVGGGVAVLFDDWRPGDGADRYTAPSLSQGYGQWGLGLLVDAGGNDNYVGDRLSQGVAGRDFNLGLGILLDLRGDDRYRAPIGHGYGVGGALLDLSGVDLYSNDHPALGAPIMHLTVLPGGDLTTLADRRDDRVWLDGPAHLNLGLGVDAETSASSRNTDGDLFVWSDFVETVYGTDPYDREDNPQTRPAAQAEKLATDEDLDGFPDFVERAFSTNPKDNRSMPLALPVGPTFMLPPPVGEATPGRTARDATPVAAKGSDKVLDLRVPVQDAGSIDFACVGPAALVPGSNALNLTVGGVGTKNESVRTMDGPCLIVGYSSTRAGEAQVSAVTVSQSGAGGNAVFDNRTLRYPPGILAIGDTVATRYDVDYFLVVDLGGDDRLLNSAGGGLPVTRRKVSDGALTESFVAPSLVLNVDVAGRQPVPAGNVETRNPEGATGRDTYAAAPDAPSMDYRQGSLWGILLDTQGDDNYTAGGGSQGALGGMLLDLAGADAYRAGDLSQGATLLSAPTATQRDAAVGLPDGGNAPADQSGTSNDTKLRRAPPGLHLDMGADPDVRKARNASQGYARGYIPDDKAHGSGILVDQGGDDKYLANGDHGRGAHAQAVATMGGLAILLDVKGNDTYSAWGIVSQGANPGQSYGEGSSNTRHIPGAALLLDTGGVDRYEYADLLGFRDRTAERQDALTLQRGELSQRGGPTDDWKRLRAEPALHYDGEDVSLNAVVGTGSREAVGLNRTDPTKTQTSDLYVDLPNARLAIGGPTATRYTHEYAFIVDLGGANAYAQNAGGVVPDVLAQKDASASDSALGGRDAAVPLFPVSFVLDAGRDGSLYEASRGFVQGAGLFSVGVLVDLGGNDRFVALPTQLPSLGSAWAAQEPTIDGGLAEPVWAGVTPRNVLLRNVNDSRYAENFTLRVANDRNHVYFAVEGHTPSPSTSVERDLLRIDLNPRRSLADRPGAEVDSVIVRLGRSGDCVILDGHHANGALLPDAAVHGTAKCAYNPANGTFVVEASKPLRPALPRDPHDLDLPYDDKSGFRKEDAQGGIRFSFLPAAAGDEYAWPPGTVRADGELGYPRNANLREEVSAWASFALASAGANGVPAPVTLTPSVSQAAAIAGVGILAHLGTTDSSNEYVASDHAQAYAAHGGLALLLDAGGSDRYRATTETQAYADANGIAALVEMEGNDNYHSVDRALGATPAAANAGALFVDLGGFDEYDSTPRAQDRDAAGGDAVPADLGTVTPFGSITAWRTGQGLGVDYLSQDNARGALRSLYAGSLFGVSRTTLTVLRTDENGACTGTPSRETVQGEERVVATGIVCLRAVVDLTGGADPRPGTTFSVDGVDFLIGGHRFSGLNASAGAAAGRVGRYEFTTRLDTRDHPDGVAPLLAVARVRATVNATSNGVAAEPGVVVFYDQAAEGNERALVRALINNPAETSLKLWPEFDGDVDAAFSPNSAIPGRGALLVDWNASHDAGEDRYGLKHGWEAPPELSNVPCAPNATRLCDLLPFYLQTGGSTFSTEPVEYLPFSPEGTFRQRAGDNPYTQRFPALQTDLRLFKADAFHLRLNTHTAILDGTYTTTLRVVLTNGNGDKVYYRNETGVEVPVVIAESVGSSEQNIGVGKTLDTVEPIRNARGPIDNAILTITENLAAGSVLAGVVQQVHAACDPLNPTTAPAWRLAEANLREVCGQFYGYVGYAAVKPCQPTPGSYVGVSKTVLDTLHEHAKGTPACKNRAMDLLNATAATGDEQLSGTTSAIGPAADTALSTLLSPPDSNPLHWLDFFLNATQPPAASGIQFPEQEGVLVVPAGYGLLMEMYVTSDGTGQGNNFGGTWRDAMTLLLQGLPEYPIGGNPALRENVSAVNQQTNQTRRACIQCTTDSAYHDTAYNATNAQRDESSSVGTALDRLVQNPIPVAFFLYGDSQATDGSRQLPARFEVRVPTEPTTRATLAIEDPVTGETVAPLLDRARVVGDVPGSPTPHGARWLQLLNETGAVVEEHVVYEPRVRPHLNAWGTMTDDSLRFTLNRLNLTGRNMTLADGRVGFDLPDGVYVLNVTTFDDSTGRADTKQSSFLLDSKPPTVTIESGEAGIARLSGGLPVTWTVDETGAGLERVWVFYRVGAGGDGWTLLSPRGDVAQFDPDLDAFPATMRSALFQKLTRETQYQFVAIGQDRVGNLENDDGDAAKTLAQRILAAAHRKEAEGGAASITLDQALPGVRGDGVAGARRLAFQGGDFSFVKAGTPVALRACAVDDDGTDIRTLTFNLTYLLADGKTLSRGFEGSLTDRCPDGSGLWTYGGWGDVNANKTLYPDGVWSVSIRAYDAAANGVMVSMGSLILDSEAPRLRVEPPVYPPGQSAVKPGDRLTLRVYAQDPFGVDDARITLDASQLTKMGKLGTRPVRVSGVVMQEASLTVDRSDLRNGNVTLTLTVPDNAGNANVTEVVIPVDFKTFVVTTAGLSNATHNSVVVRWNTTEPTTSQVRFGTSPLEMKLRSPLNATLTTEHEVKVEGLLPSTRYFLRAVSSTAGGYVNESDTLEAATSSALFLKPLGPAPGAPLRGPAEVTFQGGLLDATDDVTFTLEAQSDPDAAWSFVTTTTEPGENHTLVFNTTRYLDGGQYRLRLTAEAGKDRIATVLGPYLSDNTAPRLVVVTPLVATNDTTPRLVAEAEDALARFGADAATLLIDGKEVRGLVTDTRGERLSVSYDVEQPLAAGPHKFELRVADRAGNVATEAWTVAIDGDAPTLAANPTGYAPGRAAAKLGGTATLNFTVKDGSGLQSVVADTRGLSPQATTRLNRVTGTDWYVGTFPVTDASPDATHRVVVTATDLAGNAREATVDVPVDNVAPLVAEARAGDVGQTRATLVADANEPILLAGTVTATGAPPVTAAGKEPGVRATLPLEGLLPSRTYAFRVQAMDRAGNAVELTGRFQTALDLRPPGDVKGLSVLDLLNGTLRLTWTEATDDVGIAFYRVYRSEDAGATFRPVAEVAGTRHDDVRLPLETPYTYQVHAVDHGGNEGKGSERLTASATAVPRLTGGLVTPTVGSAATVYRYLVTYVSPGGVAPSYVRVVLDGVPQEMTLQPGGSPESGLVYAYETRLAPHKRDAPHTYHFEASDGRYTVRFPEAGEPQRGPLVSGDASASPLGGAASFAQRVPLVGAAGVVAALAAAAAIVLVLRRRGAQ